MDNPEAYEEVQFRMDNPEAYEEVRFRMDNPEAYEEVPVLELAITYDLMKSYPSDLDKDQKQAVGKRARSISVERCTW